MLSAREKLRRKRTKQKRNQKIVDLYDTGNYTMKELADRFDVTKQRIGQITKRAGINGRGVHKQRIRDRKIEATCIGCKKVFKKNPNNDKKYCTIDCYRNNGKKSVEYTDSDLVQHVVSVQEKHGEITTVTLAYETPPSYNTLFRRLGGIEKLRELAKKEADR